MTAKILGTIEREINSRISGKAISLPYMKQFIKDFEEHGTAYVAEKYCINTSLLIRSNVIKYRASIDTYTFPPIRDVIEAMNDTMQLKLLHEFETIGHIDICKKYRMRYNCTTISKWNLRLRKKFNIINRKNNSYIRLNNAIKIYIYNTYVCKFDREFVIKYLMEKYGYTHRASANALIRSCTELATKSLIDVKIYERNTFTSKEKFIMLFEMKKYGVEHIMEKYGYTSAKSVYNLIHKFKKDLNIPNTKVQKTAEN